MVRGIDLAAALSPGNAVSLEFYSRPAVELGPLLIGLIVVRVAEEGVSAGRIVETEAYPGPEDPASHAAGRIGRTRRNDPLFGPPGTVYMHCNYGVHWCMNIVAASEGKPEGVLIRALEPVLGMELMQARRGRAQLTNGPGRLGEALALGPAFSRHRLDRSPLWVEPGEPVSPERLVCSTRVGISRATARPWRWYDAESDWVSKR